MNYRNLSARLQVKDIERLDAALVLAVRLGKPLNTAITFAPFAESEGAPRDAADAFVTLRKHLTMWIHRNCRPLVGAWYVSASDDGSRPVLNYFLHVPNESTRFALAAALRKNYPRPNIVQVTGDVLFAPRSLSGPFVGRRCGMSRNIGAGAIKQHFPQARRAGNPASVSAN